MDISQLITKFSKFGFVGLIIAVSNLSCNFILLKYFSTPLIPTYILLYIIHLFFSYLLNSKYTFKVDTSRKKMILYFLVYLISMGIGVTLLKIYKYYLPFENWVYPFMVFPITILWNFTCANFILVKPSNEFSK